MPNIYTPQEIAEILKIKETSIRIYLRNGELEGAKIGNKWRITEEQLKQFLQKNTKGK